MSPRYSLTKSPMTAKAIGNLAARKAFARNLARKAKREGGCKERPTFMRNHPGRGIDFACEMHAEASRAVFRQMGLVAERQQHRVAKEKLVSVRCGGGEDENQPWA